jgi:A/G-specific adenine glycosylase
MELGASVCRARAPRCDACPVARGCPSRGAAAIVPVARQAALRGSTRAYRGALLRELAHSPDHRLGEREARMRVAGGDGRIGPALDAGEWRRILADLEREGLLHRAGRDIGLGAATIAK